MRFRLSVTAFGLAALLCAAACTPGAGSGDRPEDRSGADVNTDVAAMGDVTLTVWDQEVRGGQDKQISTLNEQFQSKYPNITIERVSRSFDDLRDTVRLGLTGNDAPDVVQVNNGKQDMGAFVKAGLLRPLDGYAQAYEWTDRFPDTIRQLASYPDTGDVLGEGKLYGLPQTGELVGIYYNKAKLAALGLQPPKTWEEFDAALAAAKGAGQLPIQMGNLDKSAGPYLFALAMHRFTDREAEVGLATGRPDATWPTDTNRSAAEQVVDWVGKGYLTPGFSGITGDDSWEAFARGEGLFHVSGTWLTPDLTGAMGDDVGFLLPPKRDGKFSVTGGTGIPWAVSAKSEHPDAAAAYLNFITSADAMDVQVANGNLPAFDTGSHQTTGLQKDVFAAWQEASTSSAIVPYLDYATPKAYDVITGAVEQLMSGQLDAAKFLDTLQADLDEHRGGR